MKNNCNTVKSGAFLIEFESPYTILKADSNFFNLLQYNPETFSIHNHRLQDIVQTDDYEDFIGALSYQSIRSNSINDRIRLIKKSGKICPVQLKGEVYTLNDGRVVIKCTCTELSALENTKSSKSYSDLEIFSQSVRCGLSKHICDNSLTLTWANDYYYKLFGYTKAEYLEIYNNTLIPLIYEEDLSIVIDGITNLLEEHEIDITFRVKHKTKPFKWINLTAACLEDSSSKHIPTANFVLNDITNLKFAEMRAELEAQKYEIISEISDEIPFEYEIDTDTITYAKKYINIFGRKRIFRHPLQQFKNEKYVSDETINNFSSIFEAAQNNKSTHCTEYQLRNKKGEYEWYYSKYSLIRNEEGNPYRAIGLLYNIDAQKKEQASLLKRAQTDAMTGLLNKATMETFVKRQLKEVQPGAYNIVLLIDIDDFKDINDTYGHLMGDKVIHSIANILTQSTTNNGFAGRIGGDEFLVFLPNILDPTLACEKAETFANKLRTAFPGSNHSPKVTLSIGIATTNIPILYNEIIERADAAVYQAKLNGKNGYVLYNSSLERSTYHNERKVNLCNYRFDLMSNVISLLSENTNTAKSIEDAIQYMGSSLNIDSICILEYDSKNTKLNKTITWTFEQNFQIDSFSDNINPLTWEEIDALTLTGTYHTANVKTLNLNIFDKKTFNDVTEFTQSKFTYQNTTLGYINFFNYSTENLWDSTTIETLNLFSNLLNLYMQKKYLEE